MNGLVNRQAVFEMKGQGLIELGEPVLKKLFHYQSSDFMNLLPFFFEQAIVDYVLGQSMLEDIFQFRLQRSGSNEIELFETPQTLVDLLFELRDSLKNFIEKGPANYRCFLKNPLGLIF